MSSQVSVDHKSNQSGKQSGSVSWKDGEMETKDTDQYDSGFMDRQMRRISEIPRISQINLARKNSKHNIGFLRKTFSIIGNSALFRIFFAILRLIPISKIIMYGLFYKKCPAEPFILLYLLVGGIAACVRDLASIVMRNCLSDECLDENEISLTLLAFVYSSAEFIWFILGSVFVYKTFGHYQFMDKTKSDYCNQALYVYAFVVTTLSYVLLFLVIFLSCCTITLARCVDRRRSRKANVSSNKS